jgi:hypothetical protein
MQFLENASQYDGCHAKYEILRLKGSLTLIY